MQYIDTNVFLRLLTNDHPEHSPRAYAYFKRLESGEIIATTGEAVLLEIVYVLSSPKSHALSRREVAERIRLLLNIPGLTIPHASAFREATECFEVSKLDFEDCLHVAHMKRQGITEIVSFDRDFDRFPDITRVEP
jgi:predicted nucleic acid-binding protein